ncbi:MAG: hypothetical protein DRP93_01430 [Candidatus Neomarinimicrobiota bacterium]|nr:MAG: hypothetical protein DRP93_01430 [Candidatus Neomarinimicrobiota bacterium]
MKRLILVIITFLCVATLTAQVSNVNVLRIADESTDFGRNLPAGTQITDLNKQRTYILTAAVAKTATIATSKTNLFEITVWRYDAINGNIYSRPSPDVKVGIGTETPGARLDVAGHIWQTSIGNSTFLGYEAGLNDDLDANYNVFIGYQAWKANSSGKHNTGLGFTSASYTISGNNNVAIGSQSATLDRIGGIITTLNNSTILGTEARLSANTETNQTVIGYQTIGNGSNTATIGNDNVTDVYMGEDGEATLQTGVIEIHGTGGSVIIGELAGVNDDYTNNRNILLGYNTGENITTGSSNIALGWEALGGDFLLKGTGSFNIGLGQYSLQSYTTGYKNIAMGYQASNYLTSGRYNISLGDRSMMQNKVGKYNIAIGDEALFSALNDENIAIGSRAAHSLTTARENIAIGYEALYYNLTGYSNITIGYKAGKYRADGNTLSASRDCILIGENTRVAGYSQYNQIVIGSMAVGNGSNTATIGGEYVTDLYAGQTGDARVHAGAVEADLLNLTPAIAPTSPNNGNIYLSSLDNKIHAYINGVWYSLNMTAD